MFPLQVVTLHLNLIKLDYKQGSNMSRNADFINQTAVFRCHSAASDSHYAAPYLGSY